MFSAGAAGLTAAIHAAKRGRRVLPLEKGKKPGVKVVVSGGILCKGIFHHPSCSFTTVQQRNEAIRLASA